MFHNGHRICRTEILFWKIVSWQIIHMVLMTQVFIWFIESVWIMWNLKRWWIVNQSEYHVSGYLDLGSIPLSPVTRAAWCQGKLDIFMVCHMDGLYCSLCVLWSFYIPVIQRWSSCYSTYEMKKCFYLLIQFGHHFWLKCIIWTIVLTCRKFVFFFSFFSFWQIFFISNHCYYLIH